MFKKVLVLDSIRSMQNVWAIFRSADGAWFHAMYLCWFTPYPMRGEIEKTALWAEKSIFWEYYQNAVEIVEKLKKEGFTIVCLEVSEKSVDFRTFAQTQTSPVCFILWNEVSWVSNELQSLSDQHVMIPMKWVKTSLNVSVAASVIMYEFLDFLNE